MAKNLADAKKNKNDEFYTLYEDVENECKNYKAQFRNKTIYCNCDDPVSSNFFKYFAVNFRVLGLKKLICTCYDADKKVPGDKESLWDNLENDIKEKSNGKAYKVVIPDVFDVNGDDVINLDDIYLMIKNDVETGDFKYVSFLEGNGDFRSDECIELLKECDIVVTNPPFSLFREYVKQLEDYGKKYLIIGNMNAITYKEIFPLIKENRLWAGINKGGSRKGNSMSFSVPKNFAGNKTIENGIEVTQVSSWWFTNLDVRKRHEELYLYKQYKGNEKDYPKYDNYDAINVDRTEDIPCDYYGVIGVPISFLDKYCPEQFEIVSFRKGEDGKDLVFTTERERENSTLLSYPCTTAIPGMIKNAEGRSKWEAYLCKNNNQTEITPIDFFYPMSMAINGLMNSPKDTTINGEKKYARILIKRKQQCQ